MFLISSRLSAFTLCCLLHQEGSDPWRLQGEWGLEWGQACQRERERPRCLEQPTSPCCFNTFNLEEALLQPRLDYGGWRRCPNKWQMAACGAELISVDTHLMQGPC